MNYKVWIKDPYKQIKYDKLSVMLYGCITIMSPRDLRDFLLAEHIMQLKVIAKRISKKVNVTLYE